MSARTATAVMPSAARLAGSAARKPKKCPPVPTRRDTAADLTDNEVRAAFAIWLSTMDDTLWQMRWALSNPNSPIARALGDDAADFARSIRLAADYLCDSLPAFTPESADRLPTLTRLLTGGRE